MYKIIKKEDTRGKRKIRTQNTNANIHVAGGDRNKNGNKQVVTSTTNSLKIGRVGPMGKLNTIILPRNLATKWLPVTFFYTYISASSSAVIRDATSCSGWEEIKRTMTSKCAET